jgi:hypothetical protein
LSFASDTKNGLCGIKLKQCCAKAECYGIFLFGRSFSQKAVSFITESRPAADRAARLAAEAAGAVMDIRPRSTGGQFVVSALKERDVSAILSAMGHTGNEVHLRINYGNIENDCCRNAFLRGVFLSCGTVTAPSKDYHLEYVVPHMNLAKDLAAFISGIYELALEPKVTKRKGAYVVYVKGGSRVADMLAFVGAGKSAMEIIQAKMFKELRNDVNRKTNFETANLDKTVSASARQRKAIKKIMDSDGLDSLPEQLCRLASLRYDNPELSLRELGEMLDPPLSRSGVNHRLEKIVMISEKLQ